MEMNADHRRRKSSGDMTVSRVSPFAKRRRMGVFFYAENAAPLDFAAFTLCVGATTAISEGSQP